MLIETLSNFHLLINYLGQFKSTACTVTSHGVYSVRRLSLICYTNLPTTSTEVLKSIYQDYVTSARWRDLSKVERAGGGHVVALTCQPKEQKWHLASSSNISSHPSN